MYCIVSHRRQCGQRLLLVSTLRCIALYSPTAPLSACHMLSLASCQGALWQLEGAYCQRNSCQQTQSDLQSTAICQSHHTESRGSLAVQKDSNRTNPALFPI